jgi:hypothetical protein
MSQNIDQRAIEKWFTAKPRNGAKTIFVSLPKNAAEDIRRETLLLAARRFTVAIGAFEIACLGDLNLNGV